MRTLFIFHSFSSSGSNDFIVNSNRSRVKILFCSVVHLRRANQRWALNASSSWGPMKIPDPPARFSTIKAPCGGSGGAVGASFGGFFVLSWGHTARWSFTHVIAHGLGINSAVVSGLAWVRGPRSGIRSPWTDEEEAMERRSPQIRALTLLLLSLCPLSCRGSWM